MIACSRSRRNGLHLLDTARGAMIAAGCPAMGASGLSFATFAITPRIFHAPAPSADKNGLKVIGFGDTVLPGPDA
jgi:hypothetical protein